MPKRRPSPSIPRRTIVAAQQELLKWCPNVEGVSNGDLEYVCWACGWRSNKRLTYCHIDRYRPNEAERPDNFILLCDRCHAEQPDALTKEVIKYWLSTRESATRFRDRRIAIFKAAIALLKDEFGDLVVDVAAQELAGDIEKRDLFSVEHLRKESAGRGSGNRNANKEWGWFADLHRWCVSNKEAVELKMQEIERALNAATGMDNLATGESNGKLRSDVLIQKTFPGMAEMARLKMNPPTSHG